MTGPRQVGKTALVRKVFPDADYVSLDLPSVAGEGEGNAEGFLQKYRKPLIIDEVQYAPYLFRYLNPIIDKDKKPGRFLKSVEYLLLGSGS